MGAPDGGKTLAMVVASAANLGATSTTLHLACAALRLGHTVQFIEPWDFRVEHGAVRARAHVVGPPERPAEALLETFVTRRATRRLVNVADADLIMPRITRPRESATHFCQLAACRGARVVNDPNAARLVANKGWLAAHPEIPSPPTVVTYLQSTGELFASRYRSVVVKPARGSGGHGVSRVDPADTEAFDRAWRDAAWIGRGFVVVQQFIEAADADAGEIRVIWLDGDVLGAYRRDRPPDGFLHNLCQGGIARPWTMTPRELHVVDQATGPLRAAGIRFAGLDIIGGRLVEVNALNPGGAFHADRLNGTRVGEEVIRRLTADPPCTPAVPR